MHVLMFGQFDVEDQLERVLNERTPLEDRYIAVGGNVRLTYDPAREHLLDFLVRAYGNIASNTRKSLFRAGIGHLFVKYTLAPGRAPIDRDSPAIVLINLAPRVRAGKQIYAFMRHFPQAKLTEAEVDLIARSLIEMTIRELKHHLSTVREVLRRLITHPRIQPERVLDVFYAEMKLDRANAGESLKFHAPRVERVCKMLEDAGSESGQMALKDFLDKLKDLTPEVKKNASRSAIRDLFLAYDVPYGHWRILLRRASMPQ